MKDIPKIIYLQIDGGEDADTFDDLDGVTWCSDRINDTDLVYELVTPHNKKQ